MNTTHSLESLANLVVQSFLGPALANVKSEYTYEAYTWFVESKQKEMRAYLTAALSAEPEVHTQALGFLDAAITKTLADGAGQVLSGSYSIEEMIASARFFSELEQASLTR